MASQNKAADTIVKTNLGSLKGKIDVVTSPDKEITFYTFHNIPYASPPIGNLRFKATQPAKPWTGILDCTIESEESYSHHETSSIPVGSEDCLKLNVYTHSISNDVKKPVMVWIHGGGFTAGSSKVEFYGPDFFMSESKDIVLVTLNYRLGIFGFLCLNDKSLGVPGNAGLKDQVMALRWIQDNIHFFGGDSHNVTVFGESAGSASVNYLLCSPMAKGLFHKCIMQSGSALNPWTRGDVVPNEIYQYFDVEGKTEADLLQKLMAASKEELLIAQSKCNDRYLVSEPRPFAPVIEGVNTYEPSLLVDDPLNIMLAGNYIKVPMIIGYNSQEGMLFDILEHKYKVDMTITNFNKAISFFYKVPKDSEMQKTIANQIKQFYFGNDDSAAVESRKQFRDLQTDNLFLRGIYITVKALLANNPHPVYFYRFSLDSKLNCYKQIGNITDEGACHSDDVFYLFKTAISPQVSPNTIEAKTIKRFIKFWTNFATSADPNPMKKDDIFDITWRQTDGLTLLNIGNKLEELGIPESARMAFWDKIDIMTKKKL